MGLTVTVGPPASGRTTLMLEAAREACAAGKRVFWVGLPAQRNDVLHRITEGNFTALGFEVMSGQQLYYRVLTGAGRLKPILPGTAALVLVGQALREVTGALPSPGEARLFTRAVAEAKRFGVTPEAYAALAADREQRRFARVYATYERAKRSAYPPHGEAWDYDDVRLNAVQLAAEGKLECGADLVIVDGLREVGPLEVEFYQALARTTEVHLSLSRAPAGLTVSRRLERTHAAEIRRYAAANPVSEARFVLRSIKHDLFEGGYHPLEIAIIANAARGRELAALANEYGLPLMNETPEALAELPWGQRLLNLLELVDHPNPARLLAVDELAPLAAAALMAGVAGRAATELLAGELGLREEWEAAIRELTVSADQVGWARGLIERRVAKYAPAGSAGAVSAPREFIEGALAKAQEAARLGASGEEFRAWWAALLQESRTTRRLSVGVTLTTPTLVAGRRFKKAYLIGAVEGEYASSEREDYFLPEEQRQPPTLSAAGARALPRRFEGRGRELTAELRSRADLMVITAPRADRGGPLTPSTALLGEEPEELPNLPAASPLELPGGAPYEAPTAQAQLPPPTAERVRRYKECPMRLWGEQLLRGEAEEEPPAWRRLLSALLEAPSGKLNDDQLNDLSARFPEFSQWLGEHREELASLTFNVRLFGGRGRAAAVLHAAKQRPLTGGAQRHAELYLFVAPGAVTDKQEAVSLVRNRWNEFYAAYGLLHQPAHAVGRVGVSVWPVGGAPIALFPRGVSKGFELLATTHAQLGAELPRYLAGHIEARPGYGCRNCQVFDLCREGVRE